MVDMENVVEKDQFKPKMALELIKMVESTLNDISNTSSFMTMAINRCIDYTKASNGLKLVPQFETIDLKEALLLPINCMRNIQSKIAIRFIPLSSAISRHIITDKQWLQENILCLLSNAAKYSLQGDVTINVRLEHLKMRTVPSALMKTPLLSPTKSKVCRSNKKLYPLDLVAPSNSRSQSWQDDVDLDELAMVKILRFEVEDNGIGVPEELMSSLFSPFKQTQRLAGGTGLGLYSLAKRIEALSGTYGVMKRLDGRSGSLFWFTIPYRPDALELSNASRQSSNCSIRSVSSKISLMDPTDLGTTEKVTQTITTTDLGQDRVDSAAANSPGHNSLTSTRATARSWHMQNNRSQSIEETFRQHFHDFIKIYDSDSEQDSRFDHNDVDSPMNSKPNLTLNTPKLNILIADDSPSIIKMTGAILRRQGNNITTAENGAVAVANVENTMIDGSQQAPFDLVLMDLQMPVMDGIEAARRIRLLEKNHAEAGLGIRHLHIIGVSANSDDETMEAAFQIGMDAFIPKPFDLEKFDRTVGALLTTTDAE